MTKGEAHDGTASPDAAARKAQTRQAFERIAPDYDAGPGCFAHFGRRLVDVAGMEAGWRVLDAACGRGAVLFPAAERAGGGRDWGEATGMDLAEAMVRATNEEAARRGLRARARVMDAERLEFADASFDLVLCGFGLMFFPDQARALGEFRRVLRPGGRAGVSTWRVSQAEDLVTIAVELGLGAPHPPGWITEPDALAGALARAGFTDVRVVADTATFRYADLEQYWQTARGTGLRRVLDSLDSDAAARVRNALAARLQQHARADGFHVPATALLATATAA